VIVGDLLEPADVYRAVSGCRRDCFGMSVSPGYLDATAAMVTVARLVLSAREGAAFPGEEEDLRREADQAAGGESATLRRRGGGLARRRKS
jgi:hypothetical protein